MPTYRVVIDLHDETPYHDMIHNILGGKNLSTWMSPERMKLFRRTLAEYNSEYVESTGKLIFHRESSHIAFIMRFS